MLFDFQKGATVSTKSCGDVCYAVTNTSGAWTYEITENASLIKKVDKDDPEAKPTRFRLVRHYLVLRSKKFDAIIVYNINGPNRAKKVPFFTHRKSKRQYLASGLERELTGRFNATEAKQIVEECLAYA